MAKLKAVHIPFWLALVGVGWGIVLFVGLAVQQNYRTAANDPQIQIAEDTVTALQQGKSASSIVPSAKVDNTQSLAPFVMIVNKNLNLLATNAEHPSLPPNGVFTDSAKHGELLFTWETAAGQRYATVVENAPNGYVIVARSLTEIERREDNLRLLTVAALIGVGGVVVVMFCADWLSTKHFKLAR